MANVWIPALLRDLTNAREVLSVPGVRVDHIIDNLDRLYPGIKTRLCDGDTLRPGIVVVVGTEVSRLGLRQPVAPDSEVHFLPAIGGG
jgi:molybdopterin synthase sulfur carrier subunit